MTGAEIVNLLGSIFGAGVFATLVNAFLQRRKLSAEATEIITKAAATTVERVEADNKRLREELAAYKTETLGSIAKLEGRLSEQAAALALSDDRERMHLVAEERNRAHLERWHRYCERQTECIRDLGGTIEDPPPMFPEPIVAPRPTSAGSGGARVRLVSGD